LAKLVVQSLACCKPELCAWPSDQKKQAAFPLPAVLHENQLNQTNGAALTQQKRLLSP
jgi:hypothetical protein